MKRMLLICLLILGVLGISNSSTKEKKNPNSLSKTTVSWAQRIKQGFNMRVWLSNQMAMGLEAWDGINFTPNGFGMEYPANSGVEHLFGAGPMIGGIFDGNIRVTEGYNGNDARKEIRPEYLHLPREHFWRTSIRDTFNFDRLGYSGYYFNNRIAVSRRGCDDDQDGLVDEDDLDGFDNDGDWNAANDDVGADGLADPYEISCDGKLYNPDPNSATYNPDPAGDNYDPPSRDKCHPNPDGSYPWKNNRDIYTERNGIPDHGEPHVDEDYGAVSHNDLYCSATDTSMRNPPNGHVRLGVKVVQKSYAWDGQFAEGVLPFDYYFINVNRPQYDRFGTMIKDGVIHDVYVGFFIDADVGPVNVPGYYEHDYTAYMESLRTAYIHNPVDRGSTPIGITVLGTPKPLDSLEYVFQWFDFTSRIGPGINDSLLYVWMSGNAFPGFPIAPSQPPTSLSDTRFMFSFGKFDELRPGDTLRISVAVVSGFGISDGPGNLKENAQKAIKLFNRGYVTPTLPISPKLVLDTLPSPARGVKVRWFPHLDARGNPGGPFSVWDDSNKLAQAFPPGHWRRTSPPCGEGTVGCSGHRCIGDSLPGGRIFSGFRLYRSEDVGDVAGLNTYTLIKEYSIPDSAKLLSIEELVARYLDSTYVDSPLVRGKRYWYSVTAFGLPDITILPILLEGGLIRYDTLYSGNSESSLIENSVGIDVPFAPSDQAGKVLVVPNPYRVDEEYTYESGGWEGVAKFWNETKRKIKFIHLPVGQWTVRIFSLVGDLITTIQNTPASGYKRGNVIIDNYRADRGEIDWDLLSESNRALASGVYVYSVESDFGTQIGKFVLIR